ncbi:hypothetical protein RB608_24840 [Nocardioides sp. LHD-245]|uniref:hypothetical protein n=1 Tax=Nocardioides sp. LHD-245 TaxID=3051387 RepID=UPI0027E0EEFE|nr:hypothetical protein [Nocardioides sp. LHD-245]
MHPTLRTARAHLASAEAAHRRAPSPVTSARVNELRAEYNVLSLEDRIRRVLDEGPPLTDTQRNRLVAAVRREPSARPATSAPKDWLSLAQAASLFGSSVTVRRLIDDGTLRSRVLPGTKILQVRRCDAVDAMRAER